MATMITYELEDRLFRAPVDAPSKMEIKTAEGWVSYKGDIARVLLDGSISAEDLDAVTKSVELSTRPHAKKIADVLDDD